MATHHRQNAAGRRKVQVQYSSGLVGESVSAAAAPSPAFQCVVAGEQEAAGAAGAAVSPGSSRLTAGLPSLR